MLAVLVSACSSSGGEGSDTDSDPTAPTAEFRIRSETVTFPADDRPARVQTYEYDARGRIVTRALADSRDGATQTFTYEYDAAGNLVTKTDGTDTDSYTYENGRLVRADRVFDGSLEYEVLESREFDSDKTLTVYLENLMFERLS